MPGIQELIADMEASVTDPQKKLIVGKIAVDSASVMAMAVTDPVKAAEEAKHIKAQTLNLAASEIAAIAGVFERWVQRIATGLVASALAA